MSTRNYLKRESEEWNECYSEPEDESCYEVPVNEDDSIDDIFDKLKEEIVYGKRTKREV